MLPDTFELCMQIYATLPLWGCSSLKGNWKSPQFCTSYAEPRIIMCMRERLEANWIKSNPLKLHRDWKDPKGKVCVIQTATSASHLYWWTEDNQWFGRIEDLCLSAPFINLLVQIQTSIALSTRNVSFFPPTKQSGHWSDRSTAGKQRKSCLGSIIDIQGKKSEYSNVSKLCYLTWESAEIRG